MKDIKPEKPTDKIEISAKEARGGRLGQPVFLCSSLLYRRSNCCKCSGLFSGDNIILINLEDHKQEKYVLNFVTLTLGFTWCNTAIFFYKC